MRVYLVLFICCLNYTAKAQELFVFTEPASNMATHTVGFRLMNSFMNETATNTINYHLMPEVMLGLSKNWMIHAQVFISNRPANNLHFEGGALYAKYRFYSKDDVHTHFRLASYGRISSNNADIHQQEIETMGHNSGYELGLVATQLLHKVALSSSLSFEKALNNGNQHFFPTNQASKAFDYTFSVGKLMLPKQYKNYKQLNVNFMVEFLGQHLINTNQNLLDIAPSIQFIINSQARIDMAYRKQLYSNMTRTATNGFALKLEYTVFNFIK